MALFVAVSIPLALAAMAYRLDVLSLLDGAGSLSGVAPGELASLVSLAMTSSNNMMQLAVIFWGLWLFPLGLLAYRSGFVPRFLGVMLMMGSAFYVFAFVGTVFDPNYQQSMLAMMVGVVSGIPVMLGETGIALWLAIKGASWRGGGKRVTASQQG